VKYIFNHPVRNIFIVNVLVTILQENTMPLDLKE